MADKSQKTEQPTSRRLQKSREQGQFPVSRELVSGVQLFLFVGFLTMEAENLLQTGRIFLRACLHAAFGAPITPLNIVTVVRTLLWQALGPLGLLFFALTVIPLLAQILTTQFGISLSKLRPDVNRLNPAQRLVSIAPQNTSAAVMAFVALVGAGVLLPLFLASHTELFTLPLMSFTGSWLTAGRAFESLLWKGSSGLLLLGLIDYFRQRRRWKQNLRMTKQEVREEHKESDGSPEMKMRLRRLRRDLLRRQMMREVPKATAVITNPTHFAVAIRYDLHSMAAPAVIAKGKNYLALRIRQKAMDLDIPIIENPPLAQALYKSVDVGQEIPPHLYRAVAEILAYIFRLMNGNFAR